MNVSEGMEVAAAIQLALSDAHLIIEGMRDVAEDCCGATTAARELMQASACIVEAQEALDREAA